MSSIPDTGKSNEKNIRYLSKIEVWALSIGCAVGWGAFVMPGTTFLPLAGPVGTALGMAIGAVIMLIIGMNYHFLMNRYPNSGGTLTYSIHAFGSDHGILSAWFLVLVYIAIMWANATAVVLIVRNLFGGIFQWGFHYQIAGYHVYLGEVLLTIVIILLLGLTCAYSKRIAVLIQTVMAIVLVLGVCICFVIVFQRCGGLSKLTPAFAPNGKSHFEQIADIVFLAPWAFVGFESVSNSTQEFKFSPKSAIKIILAALIAGGACYILLVFIAVADRPADYATWVDYIDNIGNLDGYAGIPTFYVANKILGKAGLVLLGITVTAGIVTGLIGNLIAVSRLMYAMAEYKILPAWFGKLDAKGNPRNSIRVLVMISVPVALVGRAAIGWIVDVNTIGALIAYAYTSAAAYKLAKSEKNTIVRVTGLFGLGISLLFLLYFLVPNIWTVSRLSTESYLILIIWSILGFLFFRITFSQDIHGRFGKTTAVWVTLLFFIFFLSMLWFRERTHNMTHWILDDLNQYYMEKLEQHEVVIDEEDATEAEHYIQEQMEKIDRDMGFNSWIQMAVIVIALLIMFNIYNAMMRREERLEIEKIKAEESSRAKSTFLSNMSHDLRTPMNAIIGYTNLAQKEKGMPEQVAEYLEKIGASSHHLLALINDVLELSRIENGKMELEIERCDLTKTVGSMQDLFSTQMVTKSIRYTVDVSDVTDRMVLCDGKSLNRVLLNLISNAYKFTPEGGNVSVTLKQIGKDENVGAYELRVKDTGMGMSPEFAATVFDAYSREKKASGIQGTGLGMAITKNIVELMEGTIEVQSEKGKGTEFIIRVRFELTEEVKEEEEDIKENSFDEMDFSDMNVLLVDDNEINREIATFLLEDVGFHVETAEDGKQAYERVAASKPGDFQVVLMDVQMPVMNGYEATKAIRGLEDKELSSLPIIAMTANAFAEDVQAAKEAGMDGHVAKPIDFDQLMQTLVKILE